VADADEPARFVLYVLIARYPALLTVDELAREFARTSAQRETARVCIEDGIAELAGNGLVHRLGEFAFASRAAVRGRELHPD
jgi:hypothetical protein